MSHQLSVSRDGTGQAQLDPREGWAGLAQAQVGSEGQALPARRTRSIGFGCWAKPGLARTNLKKEKYINPMVGSTQLARAQPRREPWAVPGQDV